MTYSPFRSINLNHGTLIFSDPLKGRLQLNKKKLEKHFNNSSPFLLINSRFIFSGVSDRFKRHVMPALLISKGNAESVEFDW